MSRLIRLFVVLALLGGSTAATFASPAPPDVIRVGGPSAPDDAKVALVLSSRELAGRPFTVTAGNGHVVYQGTLRPISGAASPWQHASAADLSAVTDPGRYTVEASGVKSRPWVVQRDPGHDLIRLMLRFFSANADGREPSWLHGPAHLHDAVIASGAYKGRHFDLTGGWMDAGDMIHFTQTTGFTAMVLEAAARLDPVDATALRASAAVGERWLVKAHPRPDLFVAQVGDTRDHDALGWRNPSTDDNSGVPGIAVRSAYPGISGDLGGKSAAALALAAAHAHGRWRTTLVAQAEAWYAAGRRAHDTTPKLPGDFYASNSWTDDMAVGAAALYRLTGEQRYAADASRFLRASDAESGFDWDSVTAFAAADLCGALGAPPTTNAALRQLACQKLQQAGDAAGDQANTSLFGTPGAFLWGQTTENSGNGAVAAMSAASVDPTKYPIAVGARDWLLGRNPWGAGFVVGYGANAPRHPHHWSEAYAPGNPVGAVVGGPSTMAIIGPEGFHPSNPFNTSGASYEDNEHDYVTSEPACDYTASSVLLLAALVHARDDEHR